MNKILFQTHFNTRTNEKKKNYFSGLAFINGDQQTTFHNKREKENNKKNSNKTKFH